MESSLYYLLCGAAAGVTLLETVVAAMTRHTYPRRSILLTGLVMLQLGIPLALFLLSVLFPPAPSGDAWNMGLPAFVLMLYPVFLVWLLVVPGVVIVATILWNKISGAHAGAESVTIPEEEG